MAKMQAVRGRGLKELIINKKGLRKLTTLSVYDNPYLSIEAYEGISHLKSLVSAGRGSRQCHQQRLRKRDAAAEEPRSPLPA